VSSPSPVVPDPDTGAPPLRSPTPVRLEAWPARLGAPPGLFKAAAAPWTAYPSNQRRRNPSSSSSPPPSSFRRQGIAPEPRKEVSSAPVLHVVVPVHPAALATSPESAPRAAVLTARAAASPPEPPL
jgi:hypothetical protein